MQSDSETAGLHKEHDKAIFLVTSPSFEALLAPFYKTRVRKIAPERRGNATCTKKPSASFKDVPKMSVAEDGSDSRQVKGKSTTTQSYDLFNMVIQCCTFWLASML